MEFGIKRVVCRLFFGLSTARVCPDKTLSLFKTPLSSNSTSASKFASVRNASSPTANMVCSSFEESLAAFLALNESISRLPFNARIASVFYAKVSCGITNALTTNPVKLLLEIQLHITNAS